MFYLNNIKYSKFLINIYIYMRNLEQYQFNYYTQENNTIIANRSIITAIQKFIKKSNNFWVIYYG